MKPNRRRLLTLLPLIPLFLLLCTIGSAAYWVKQRDAELHRQNITGDILLKIKERDTALDKDVLRLTSLRLANQDTLVDTVDALQELQAELRALPATQNHAAGAALDRYVKLSEEKIQQLERIKATTASLQNSLHYLPTVVTQLRKQDAGIAESASIFFSDLLVYNLMPTPSMRTKLSTRISSMQADSSRFADASLERNMLFHADANLRFRSDLQAQWELYRDIDTGGAISRLQDAYDREFEHRTIQANRLSLGLFVITALLFGLLAWTIHILIRARNHAESAWRQLHDAIESISEGFALFGPDQRLVMWNTHFERFYPRLQPLLTRGVSREAVLKALSDQDTASGGLDDSETRGEIGHIEHIADDHCYLVSENVTSDGGVASVHVDISERRRMEERLREMYQAVEQSPASVIITDLAGNIEYVNPKFEEVSGYRAEEVLGHNPRLLKSGETSREEYTDLWTTITAGQVWHGEFHNRRKNGDLYWEAATISGIRDNDGRIVRFLAVKEDISERKRTEEELRLAAKVFENTTEAVIVTDADNLIKTVNPGFTQITGYSADEVIGRSPAILTSGRHGPEFYRDMWQTLERADSWEGEIWNRRKNGEVFPEWLSISVIRNDDGEIVEHVAVFSDITRRKAAEQKIRWQANYDALTELPNRSLFLDRLTNALSMSKREHWMTALMFIDLDRFKVVNDTLGHIAGDSLLQQVAKRLAGCVRRSDTVSRLGGDEFTVILQNIIRQENAGEIAKNIIRSLSRPFEIDGQDVQIGASIGITLYPEDGKDSTTLIRNADLSMYQAKLAGRNSYRFFTRKINEHLRDRMSLEKDLRRALAREEFFLEYQPIVQIGSGRIVDAEALVRWQHPELGRLGPDQFIPIAEEIGVIAALGKCVLKAACREAASWPDKEVGVSINVSSLQFRDSLTPDAIDKVLSRTGLTPRRLTLEITESLMIRDTDAALTWMHRVRDMGIHLSIDDFGTGYSSLSYLKRFPVDLLKIDQAFVRDVTRDADDASLVTAITSLAHQFGMKTIAEGVETSSQLDFLRSSRCDFVQGFLFSRPLAAATFRQRLTEQENTAQADT